MTTEPKADGYTEVIVKSGGGIGEWGHVDPQEAIDRARRHFLRQRDEAMKALDDIADGEVSVFYQEGVWARRNRRQVWPKRVSDDD